MIWTFSLALFSLMEVGDDNTIRSHYAQCETKNSGIETWDMPGITMSDHINGSDNKVIIQSQWTYDSLYLFFSVEDADLRAYQTEIDHKKLFLDDMVEVLIDPRYDKGMCWTDDDIVYHVNLLGVKKDDRGTTECASDWRWDGTATFRIALMGTLNDTTDIDRGYTVEMAIPWAELGMEPDSGRKLAIDFANGDNDGTGRQLFDWVGAWPLRSPHSYGDLILSM